MRKFSSTKRKPKSASGRAKKSAPSASSRPPRASASRAKPKKPPQRRPRAAVPPSSPPSFFLAEGKSLGLLVAPFLILTLAVAAIQWIGPKDAARRQFALLPQAQVVSAVAPSLGTLAPAPLKAVLPEARPTLIRSAPASRLASTLAPSTRLRLAPPVMSVVATLAQPGRVSKCVAPQALAATPPQSKPMQAVTPEAFGRMLAKAALAQTRDLVVYKDSYRQIGFPMGDVPAFYGVCTDVVVRAYRVLGIDLQVLVHKARIGTGDPSIDHRRTGTLRRFFARSGVSLPITDFAEDYRPGDIVTYHRASGRASQSHIAIVSDVIAPSGRPMIVHNRGWGPQLEDALFASRVTGHFRFMPDASADETAERGDAPFAKHAAAHTPLSGSDRMIAASAAR